MLRLHALKKDWYRRFLAQKKINVGIELVLFVSYWNYSWSSFKKKKWNPASPPKQTGQRLRLFPSKRSHANSIYCNRLLAKYQIHSWLRRLRGLQHRNNEATWIINPRILIPSESSVLYPLRTPNLRSQIWIFIIRKWRILISYYTAL